MEAMNKEAAKEKMEQARCNKIHAHIEEAIKAVAKGFFSKAEQKRAMGHLNSAYYWLRDMLTDAIIAAKNSGWNLTERKFPSIFEIPYDLANWKPAKHSKMYECFQDQAVSLINELLEMREAYKQMPIVKKPVSSHARLQAAVKEKVGNIRGMIVEGVRLAEIFGNLPISVNVHSVYFGEGREYLRCFYFMNGKITKLGTILAIMEELEAAKA